MDKNIGTRTLRKRLLASIFAVAFIFFILLSRLFFLQIASPYKFTKKALDQWTRDLPIRAERGTIYDRNGKPLAESITSYDLYVRPRNIENAEVESQILSTIIDMSKDKIYTKMTRTGSSEITLIKGLDKPTLLKVQEAKLKGVYYSISEKRIYPEKALACSVLGFISSDGNGQSGVEKYYNDYLRGKDGKILTQSDLIGHDIINAPMYYVEGKAGFDVYLTIDLDFQKAVEEALASTMENNKPKSCSALVMDVNSGEILAMANLPSYDLNEPPRNDVDTLMKESRNSIVTDIYEPGSTFKVLTASANTQEYINGNSSAFSTEHIFSSSPIRVIDGQRIKCWSNHANGKHSRQNLKLALQNSCNPVFVDIAMALQKDTFYDYLDKFGYGQKTGIDYPGEAKGMLVSKDRVKNCDLARIGFGQTIAVTGLQLVNATASAVNGGVRYQPHLMSEVKTKEGVLVKRVNSNIIGRSISEEASEIMRDYLESVVAEGSGSHAQIDGVRVGGKTGTAQKYENGHIAHGKYISSFVGFYPAEKPKYICLASVNEPEGVYYGSLVAAPIVKDIFESMIEIEGERLNGTI